jgi:hypothetical protein
MVKNITGIIESQNQLKNEVEHSLVLWTWTFWNSIKDTILRKFLMIAKAQHFWLATGKWLVISYVFSLYPGPKNVVVEKFEFCFKRTLGGAEGGVSLASVNMISWSSVTWPVTWSWVNERWILPCRNCREMQDCREIYVGELRALGKDRELWGNS